MDNNNQVYIGDQGSITSVYDSTPLKDKIYKGIRSFFKRTLEVSSPLQVSYIFSLILLILSVTLVKTPWYIWVTILAAVVSALVLRGIRITQLAKSNHKNTKDYHKSQKLLFRSESFIIGFLSIAALAVGFTTAYHPAPLRRAIGMVLVAYALAHIDKKEQLKGKTGIINLLLFVFGFFTAQIGHLIYQNSPSSQAIVNTIFNHLLPATNGITGKNTTWLNWGMPLFAGCLIIINWFRARPCSEWNPYTVQELSLSNHVIYCAVFLISSLLYCYISDTKRAPVFMIVGLVFVDIYTLYLQNAQNPQFLVRRKLIDKMKLRTLIDNIIEENDKRSEKKDKLDDKTKSNMESFARSTIDISRTILKSEIKPEKMVEHYQYIASGINDRLPAKDDQICNTVGFLFGLSIRPCIILTELENELLKHDDKRKFEKEETRNTFVQAIKDSIGAESDNLDAFYKMLITGIIAGDLKEGFLKKEDREKDLELLKKYMTVEGEGKKPDDNKQKERIIDPEEGFYSWLIDTWIGKTEGSESNNTKQKDDISWHWVDELWTNTH